MSDSTSRPLEDIPRFRARGGFAMALALGAIVVIGMLIAGVFFISTQQARAGRNVMAQEQVFRVAEAGLAQVITQWPDSIRNLTPGQSYVRAQVPVDAALPPSRLPTVRVTMLNSELYQVQSEASAGTGGGARHASTRRVSEVVRVIGPIFNVRGALTVRGATKIGGSSLINGYDDNPAGWTCDPEGSAMPGIATPDPSKITTSGCNNLSCVSGEPKILKDSVAAKDETYFDYGDAEWADLVSMANIVVTTDLSPAPAWSNGVCTTSLKSNWGDVERMNPARPCEKYFPIIYYPGNAKLTGGTGQGILLVEGDLLVQGQFKFFGPVIVRGRLKTEGTGGHFNGAVMAANVELEENSLLGNAVVNYSACAVETAMRAAGRARPVVQRSWVEMN